MKQKRFCKVKGMVSKSKPKPTYWERIFTNPTSDRELISKIYKELKKLDTNNSNNSIKNQVQSQTENSQQRTLRMADKYS